MTPTASVIDPGVTRGKNVREGRIFAFTLAGGFLAVALLAMRRGHQMVEAAALSAAAVSVLAGLLVPGRLGPVKRAWMKLGEAIGYVTTPVVMAIVYYFLVTPIAAVRRLAAGRRQRPKDSTWHQRPPLPPPERMERQF